MVVQHNISAMNANRLYGINNSGLSKSLEKLSSGYAINRAGDNAAGLAVSEKMRAQISGLTQASKNAEDGISMVQTFEGALQETDSILQRMRTLAVQSANGTYQNDVDREAIQLEYDQLNDELNQIADTDFNGVVVLNGGKMADGLKAIDGEFNYATAVRDPKQLSSADINTLDNTKIDKTAANAAWKAWSTGAGNYDRADATKAQGPDSVEIEFTYDGDGGWKATGCSDAGMDLDKITTGIVTGKDTAENNGGFILTAAGAANTNEIANVILDTSKLQKGDTIKLTVSNPNANNTTSMNFGVATNGITDNTAGLDANNKATLSGSADLSKVTFTIDKTAAGIQSTYNKGGKDMTAETKALLDALDGASITVNYDTDGTVTAAKKGISIHLDGELNATDVTTKATAFAAADVTKLVVDGKVVGYANIAQEGKADGATNATLDIYDLDGNKIATFGTVASAKADANGNATTGKVTYKIANDASSYSDDVNPSVSVSEPKDGSVSKSNSNDASTATLTYTDNITLQVGARTKDSVNFTFKYESKGLGELNADLDCSARGLGTDQLSLATQKDANGAIDKIDNAINKVSMVRATFGAMQNRLEHKIANLDVNNENLTAAESRIRDTDMAEEMTNFTKNQILAQASQAMLAQANQLPQGVLQLLG